MSSKPKSTRDRILHSALELLVREKGSGVRMTDIAKRAGVSRQAVYLHFETRLELLVATTHYLDALNDSETRLEASRGAATGVERLDAYIEGWGNYIPEIYGCAKAMLALSETDPAAAQAWGERMQDMREGCEAAVEALVQDGVLATGFDSETATDLLWTMLSVQNWEQLTVECRWSQADYVSHLKESARRLFVHAP